MSVRVGSRYRSNSWINQDSALTTQHESGFTYIYLKLDQECPMPFFTCLTLSQREGLWLMFFMERVSALELDYVMQEPIDPQQLWLWEIAARSAMTKVGLTVMNDKEHFMLINDQKEVLRLDFQHGCAAEKLLLKVIFPLPLRS